MVDSEEAKGEKDFNRIISVSTMTIQFGFKGAVISRIMLGAVHGPVTSIIAASFFTWIPPDELTLATTISTMGIGLNYSNKLTRVCTGEIRNQ